MLENVIEMALEAGALTLKYYGADVAISEKEGGSPVTRADIEANELITRKLKELDPSIPIISEESEIPPHEFRCKWKRFWLVDPLDGTAEFIEKLGDFTVNIALIDAGEPVLGVIYAPARSMLYFAERSRGAWKQELGGEKHRIFSNAPDKKGPLVVVGSRRHGTGALDKFLARYKVKQRISIGSSLKFCLVAEGLADIYPRLGPTMEWDVAAGDCIYRNSVRTGQRQTSLLYNKPDLHNSNFVIGMTEFLEPLN